MKRTTRLCAGLLLSLAPCAVAGEDAGCVYQPAATALAPEPEPTTVANCGSEKGDGTALIRPEHLAAIDFGADGLAVVRVGEHFYYFRPDGRSARVPTYDNWADDFAEGLVRTVRAVDGVEKVGYLAASVIFGVGMVALFSARTGQLWAALLACAAIGIGYAGCQLFPLAMLPDVELLKRTDRP